MSNEKEFTGRYQALLRHYQMEGQKIQAGKANENGDIEQRDQALMLRGRGKHRVDYRHIITWLVRKPGAFENYRYRDELFPTSRFRMAWDALREVAPARANKRYLEILKLASEEGEARVDEALRTVLEEGELGEGKLNGEALGLVLAQETYVAPVTGVEIAEVELALFDELLDGSLSEVGQ